MLKPDNPRACRYWHQQRRQARQAQQGAGTADPADQEDADLTIETLDLELFHLGRELGVHDVLGQRVLQVSSHRASAAGSNRFVQHISLCRLGVEYRS